LEKKMTEPQSKTLLDLNHIHHQLDELFLQHQVALLKGDYVQAKNILKTFEEALFNHIKEEEEILLPLYRQRTAQIRGDDAEIFSAEHKKITEWMNRLKLRASRLSRSDSNWKEIIALLDDEAQFKKYMEHHTVREDRIFYPEVDRVVDEKEKAHLMRLLTFSIEENPDPPTTPDHP
jgi:iron-sulfur cluster repair protein YtfE (RIC family)